ncbi:unnamed protein product [Paramecium sonneborni]|uniref:PHD-type domain-containing protein n=1 Tax=Paramecium sonneborni TaxID=65129 RepID=A0A8S1LPH5_9CILI|nr:unnamed protein product [Paramecium sonneborni]
MNSGLNNQNSLLQQLTPAQLEEYQLQLRQQQFFTNLLSSNLKTITFPSIFQQFQDNLNRTSQQQDLINFNRGLGAVTNQNDYMKLLQKSFQINSNVMSPFHQNQLFCQMGMMGQKKNNTIQNPITVEDDEPPQNQKCHNSKCNNRGDRKIKSKKGESLQFCEKCLRMYNRGNFCDFCEQVYSNGSYDQDEQEWIQCDECEKWNHLNCEAKYRNQNIKEQTENKVYYCLNCSKVKKQQQQQQQLQQQQFQQQKKQEKTTEEYQPKQRLQMECEDARTREKNINFVATKDNKVQFTFRLNLYDDEIKSDLDILRNSGRKSMKKQNQQDSPIIKQIIAPPQQQQQQQVQLQYDEKNSDQQMNTRCRTRNNKNRVNYRNLGGE